MDTIQPVQSTANQAPFPTVPARQELSAPTDNSNANFVIKTNADLKREADAKEESEKATEQVVNSLAAHIRTCWEAAKYAKINNKIVDSLVKCEFQRKGEYEPNVLNEIRKTGGSESFLRMTSQKCTTAESWIKDTLLPAGDKVWGIDPSPIPNLNPELQPMFDQKVQQEIDQMEQSGMTLTPEDIDNLKTEALNNFDKERYDKAKESANRMEKLIEDQLLEGGWEQAFKDFIMHLTTFPAAIIKGPFTLMKKKLKYVQDPATGKFSPKIEVVPTVSFKCVNPHDWYPSPESSCPDDGYCIEKIRYQPKDIVAMRGLDGYNDNNINQALEQYGRTGLREYTIEDYQRNRLENKNIWYSQTDRLIDALEFWGSVPGQLLEDWGMHVEDVYAEYEVWAILIGNYVIKAELNPDTIGRKPYHVTSFEKVAGSNWGFGIPQKMEATQQFANAVFRSLVNNIGIASGPMVAYDYSRLVPGQDLTHLHPWKVFLYKNAPGQAGSAVNFFQPDSRSQELAAIIETCKKLADDDTGVPRYVQGEQSGASVGASRTASGLSMLMQAASKTIKQVIANVDKDVIQRIIQMMYDRNMIYSDDESIKGDCIIKVRGSIGLTIKEATQEKRTNLLQMILTQPQLQQFFKPDGILALIADLVKGCDLPSNEIVYDPATFDLHKELNQVEQEKAQMAAQQQGQMQVPPGTPPLPPGQAGIPQGQNVPQAGQPPVITGNVQRKEAQAQQIAGGQQ